MQSMQMIWIDSVLMDYLRVGTKKFLLFKKVVVQFAKLTRPHQRKLFAWIIVIKREKLGDYCAIDAIQC